MHLSQSKVHLLRLSAFLLSALFLVSLGQPSQAQPASGVAAELKPYTMSTDLSPQTSLRVMNLMKTSIRITGPDERKNKEAINELCQHFIYRVTQPKYYDSGATSGELRPRESRDTLDAIFREFKGYVLSPNFDSSSRDYVNKMTLDHAAYIQEFGQASDNAIREVLKKSPPALIRVNTARMLALVSESGAPVHAKLITELLTDPSTPPEVLYHTYVAAGNLLAAADPYAVRTTTPRRHSVPLKELIPLIQALEKHIIPGPPVADKVALVSQKPKLPVEKDENGDEEAEAEPKQPDGPGRLEAETLAPEQVAVIQYFRRAAVRALANVRYDMLGGEDGLPQVRPALVLARVAMNDVAVNPPPTSTEQAEAVIGLCRVNLSPVTDVEVLCQAIGYGVISFARLKNDDVTDRSIPWRIYAVRMSNAFADFEGSIKRNPRALSAQNAINGITRLVQTDVLNRLDRADSTVGAAPNIERIYSWMRDNQPKKAGLQLFEDSATSKLSPRELN